MTDDELKKVFNALRKVYSEMSAEDFCKVLGFNVRYDLKYFASYGKGINALFVLSDDNLIKLIRWGEQHGK